MPERAPFDYTIIRVVPRVERGECLNAGVIVYSRSRRFLDARIRLDHDRLRSLDPDCDPEDVQRHLDAIPLICRGGRNSGPIGELAQPDRWYWLVAPRSTIIQPSPVHSGLSDDPRMALERLFVRYVTD